MRTLILSAAVATMATAAHAETGPIDANGDGVLDRDEFAPIAALGGNFEYFDDDGDGTISRIEFNNNVRRAVRRDGRTVADSREDALRVDEVTAAFSNPSEY